MQGKGASANFSKVRRAPSVRKPTFFGGFADAEHGNALAGDMRLFTETFEGIDAAVMGGDHAEAGGTAVHGVVLDIMRKSFH
jgi:hypothetical protein